MANSMLPANATRLEKALVQAITPDLDVPIRDVWDPQRCPSSFLPYLAQSFSVDRWDENWSDDDKRAAIEAAFFVHKHKGTKAAIRRVVEPLGFLIEIREWWQQASIGNPYTFSLVIGVKDKGMTDAMYEQMVKLIFDAKPLRADLIGLDIQAQTDGLVYLGAGCYSGDIDTVYPPTLAPVASSGSGYYAAAEHSIDMLSIYPQTSEYPIQQ
ncbi:phage tail protein I [Celerinatantimonas sp. YJH-8]|uniref:phage tail protein I n=1 Tax=Celerinatantimonas sp. YJH-8 TaxID=3228714 RepID=UPI0038C055E5